MLFLSILEISCLVLRLISQKVHYARINKGNVSGIAPTIGNLLRKVCYAYLTQGIWAWAYELSGLD